MTPFNLRNAPPKPTAAGDYKPRTIPGLGQVPLRPGEVVMVDSEKKDLIPIGWQDGDPVPPGLAAQIAKARQEAFDDVRSGRLPGFENLSPLKVPEAIPIDKLPPEKQAALRQMMADWKEMVKNPQADLSGLHPSILQAMKVAGETMGQKKYEVFDSRKEKAAAPPPLPSAPATEVPPPDGPAIESAALPPHCPRCGWDQKLPAAVEPGSDDKANFLIAVMGGKPFVKQYRLFGGRIVATFRQFRSTDSDLVRQQLSADQRDGRILNFNDMSQLGADYRTALSLFLLETGSGTLNIAQAVDSVIDSPGPEDRIAGDVTILPQLVKKLKSREPFNIASTWNALAATVDQFMAMLDTLERRAEQPDFWPAIGV